MKRREMAAVLMAVFMIGALFAGCGSVNNKDVNLNEDNTQNTQITTKADSETKAEDETETAQETEDITIEETESTTQITDTEEIVTNNDSADESNEISYEPEISDNQNNDSEEPQEPSSQAPESQVSPPASGVNINDDNRLLAAAKVNTVTYSAYANEVLGLVNAERAKVGAAPLVLDEALCNAANMRAIEMDYSGVFSHTRPDGRACFTVFKFCNISYYACGENIAAGYLTPAAVVDGWMHSEGHKANILNSSFTKMGLGYSTGGGGGTYGHYWAQEFAG